MSFSNYLETELLDHVFTNSAYTAPSTLYLALFTGAPGEAGGGTEVSGSGYLRQTAAFTVSGNTATNSASIEFPAASGGNWGTVGWIGIMDASSGGNMIIHSALDTAKAINDGDVFRIPTGDLDITAS